MHRKFSSILLLTAIFPAGMYGSDQETDKPRHNYVISLGSPSSKSIDILAKVRRELWSHFRRHLSHVIEVTWVSKEGEPSKYTFKVCPKSQQTCYIDVNVEQHLRERGGPAHQRKYVVRSHYTGFDVALVDHLDNRLSREPTAPSLEFFKTHKLQLLDNDGKTLQQI